MHFINLFLQVLSYFQCHLKFRKKPVPLYCKSCNNVKTSLVIKKTFFSDCSEETHIINSPSHASPLFLSRASHIIAFVHVFVVLYPGFEDLRTMIGALS